MGQTNAVDLCDVSLKEAGPGGGKMVCSLYPPRVCL